MLVLKIVFVDDSVEEFVCDNFNFDGDSFNIFIKDKLVREVPYSSIIMFYCIPFDSGLI